MTSAQERFKAAVNVIKGLPKNGPYQPSNSMMLKFYGLYKQATEGSCNQGKPAFWEVINKAKWDAWNRNSHLSKEEAMEKYVENLQEIIETMSFTENVQNFVGSLQGLENINLDELEKIAPGMKQLAESHPNSPFHSRTNSPQHTTNHTKENSNFNVYDPSPNSDSTAPIPSIEVIERPLQSSQLLSSSVTNTSEHSQTNGSSLSDQSDDEYVDPFDIQNEFYESIQRNTTILKQVQATVVRMNSDMSSINQRLFEMERTLRELKNSLAKQRVTENIVHFKPKYHKLWPFTDISPLWFVLLVLGPLIVNRAGKLMANSSKHK